MYFYEFTFRVDRMDRENDRILDTTDLSIRFHHASLNANEGDWLLWLIEEMIDNGDYADYNGVSCVLETVTRTNRMIKSEIEVVSAKTVSVIATMDVPVSVGDDETENVTIKYDTSTNKVILTTSELYSIANELIDSNDLPEWLIPDISMLRNHLNSSLEMIKEG